VRSSTFNNAVFSTQLLDSYIERQRSAHGDFMAGDGQIDSTGMMIVNPNVDSSLAQISSQLLAWNPAPLSHGLLSDTGSPVVAGTDTKEMKPMSSGSVGQPFNVFVAGNVVLAQNFSQADLAHSDSTTGGVQLGADYRVTPHLRAGALFSFQHTDGDLDNNGSTATIDSYAPGAYVSFADKGWYATATGNYGFNTFTEDRHISIGGASAIAHGAPSGDQIVGDFDGGYDFHVKDWTFGPLAGVQYTHLDVNSFSEDGAESIGANESVGKQQTDSLRSRLGGHLSYVFHTGTVQLTPHLDASWQHEFMDQGEGINAQIVDVVGAPFTVRTPNPSRDSALVDCGLNADLNGQISIFGDYLVQAGQSNYFGQSVQAGVKVGF
jgi:outer membrane autotransporter protein